MQTTILSDDDIMLLNYLMKKAIENEQYGIKELMSTGLVEYADESIQRLSVSDFGEHIHQVFFNSGCHLRYIGSKKLPVKKLDEDLDSSPFDADYDAAKKSHPLIRYSIRPYHDTPAADTYQFEKDGKLQFRDDGTPIMLIRDTVIAFRGMCRVVADRNEMIGGKNSMDYSSGLIVDPTWDELWTICHWQAGTTRDFHYTEMTGAHHVRTEKTRNGYHIKIIVISLNT